MKFILFGASGFIGRNLIRFIKFDLCVARTLGNVSKSDKLFCDKWLSYDDLLDSGYHSNDDVCIVYASGIAHGNYTNLQSAITSSVELLKDAVLFSKRFISVHFIYLSSSNIFSKSLCDQESDYSQILKSKIYEETFLSQCSVKAAFEFSIIRMPTVYGLNTPGNFDLLIRLSTLRIPLPFGCFKNKSSYLFVGNLASFIEYCAFNGDAFRNILVVSDFDDKSIVEIVGMIRRCRDAANPIFYIPSPVLEIFFTLIGKVSAYRKMSEGDVVLLPSDNFYLNWTPPFNFEEAINKSLNL